MYYSCLWSIIHAQYHCDSTNLRQNYCSSELPVLGGPLFIYSTPFNYSWCFFDPSFLTISAIILQQHNLSSSATWKHCLTSGKWFSFVIPIILENLFLCCNSCVKWDSTWSAIFQINLGVRQGSVLAPFCSRCTWMTLVNSVLLPMVAILYCMLMTPWTLVASLWRTHMVRHEH